MRERFEHLLELIEREPNAARLATLASAAGISPFHLQRTFRRWVGLSPQQVAAFAAVARAEGPLRAARRVLDVSLDLGLSGPARLHDRFVTVEALSPGEWAAAGRGVAVTWGVGATPLGPAVIGWTQRGIFRLHFLAEEEPRALIAADLPEADLRRDDRAARKLLTQAFTGRTEAPLALVVRGTGFQIAVWRALLSIPPGGIDSYGGIARRIGLPAAARAVGGAIGANRIALLIPCHRAITAGGLLGGYRWGTGRKAALLARECAGGGADRVDGQRPPA